MKDEMSILDSYGKLKKGNKPRTKVTLSICPKTKALIIKEDILEDSLLNNK